eukprot:CAMPEP_0117502380 /NCGR_PEP_ID=MMETSP0784-20121206/23783_1 /TAXON_ID=39447 /ORGANISM="" /LENGTH=441 /DNA_ID=CAMNT_0005297661 /DNA_START=45 /DNA_END=1369 /DNA_ORIENTATION=-
MAPVALPPPAAGVFTGLRCSRLVAGHAYGAMARKHWPPALGMMRSETASRRFLVESGGVLGGASVRGAGSLRATSSALGRQVLMDEVRGRWPPAEFDSGPPISGGGDMFGGSNELFGRGAAGRRGETLAQGKYFTKTHEWFQVESDGVGTLGITQVAQRAIGEVVFCRLPREGERFAVMDAIVTLEGLKTTGEVKCPVAGEVLEVNPRLEKEPGLLTFAPLTEGWLVRMRFRRLPHYLERTRVVTRAEVEDILGDPAALQNFVLARLEHAEDPLRGLIFDGLRSDERLHMHQAAEAVGLSTKSRGRGAGRQLVVSHAKDEEGESEHDDGDAADGAPRQEHSVASVAWQRICRVDHASRGSATWRFRLTVSHFKKKAETVCIATLCGSCIIGGGEGERCRTAALQGNCLLGLRWPGGVPQRKVPVAPPFRREERRHRLTCVE